MIMDALDNFLKQKEMAKASGQDSPEFLSTMGNYMGARMLDKTGLDKLGFEGANLQMNQFLMGLNNPQMGMQGMQPQGMQAPQMIQGVQEQQMINQPGQAMNVTQQGDKRSNLMMLAKLFGG